MEENCYIPNLKLLLDIKRVRFNVFSFWLKFDFKKAGNNSVRYIKRMTGKCGPYKTLKEIYLQGVPEKSTHQIVIDNFEHWTARTKLENDSESIKLTSNLIIWKSMNVKNQHTLKRSMLNFQVYTIQRCVTSPVYSL